MEKLRQVGCQFQKLKLQIPFLSFLVALVDVDESLDMSDGTFEELLDRSLRFFTPVMDVVSLTPNTLKHVD